MSGELAALARIRDRLEARGGAAPAGETWIGDDAAVLMPPERALLLAADAVVEGVHADFAVVGVDDFGWKALAVNVSDIAAMGGRPRHAVVCVMGPADTDVDLLYDGLAAAAERFSCPIVGGDLSNAPVLAVAVTVTGEPVVDRAVLRSGAAPGDEVFVTGPLGASAAGLRALRDDARRAPADLAQAYRRPVARVEEGAAAARAGATAMIDVSDGLAIDLRRLTAASRVGVDLAAVPVAPGASLDDALGGGEDYELVFTASDGGAIAAAFDAAGLRPPTPIGMCTADAGVCRLAGEDLPDAGWEHAWR